MNGCTTRLGVVGPAATAYELENAAASLGIELVTLDPSGAGRVERPGCVATLEEVVARSSVITVGFGCALDTFGALLDTPNCDLRPNASTIRLAHDPLAARRLLHTTGFDVAECEEVRSGDDDHVQRFARRHGWPVRLRAPRWGRDRPAIHVVRPFSALDAVWGSDPARRWLIESWEPFATRVAVVMVRTPSGRCDVLRLFEDGERDAGPCAASAVPASVRQRAISMAQALMEGADATGVVAVQFLHTRDARLLVDDFVHGPAACAAAVGVPDDAFVVEHLRAILDRSLDRADA